MSIGPMPAGSKTDTPLAEAEPISSSDSTSVKTFKKEKKLLQEQHGEGHGEADCPRAAHGG